MTANRAIPPPPLGWPLLPFPDRDGRLQFPTLEQSVRHAIQIILRTRPGEQLMRPAFGAGLDALLHEQNTVTTRRRIRDLITQSLTRWEQRILLDRVDVNERPDRPSEVRVEIAYRLKRTGAAQQLGLTMELES